MKKLMSILLVVLMLIPLIVSCGGNDVTTTTESPTTEAQTTEAPTTEAPTTEAPTTEAPTTEAPTTEAPSTIDPNAPWSSKTDIRDTWSGKTLNVACSTWYSTSAPWAMPEVFITEENDAKFGVEIQNAVLERNKFIESTYGIKVNWINATKASMHNVLEAATIAKNINYDLALPRLMNAHSIVAGGYVYDLANRAFIDFDNTYYNSDSVKTYTAHGHTFFVTGGFSTLDIDTSSILLFNKDLLSEEITNDIYDMVRKGEWTFDKLFAYSEAAYSDNGDGIRGNDIYGTALNPYNYYDYFGVKNAGVNEATGQWEITIKGDRTDDVINTILKTINHNEEAFITYGARIFFNDNQVTFSVENLIHLEELEVENIGIVPFPMLDKEQGRYYVPCYMSTSYAMCIPKLTQDREMSEYFMDVLFWTGEDYVVKVYIDKKMEKFGTEAEREMITEYIIPNISYDAGAAVGWGRLIDVRYRISDTYKNNENHFDEVYVKEEPDALKTVAEWNAAWGGYTEE